MLVSYYFGTIQAGLGVRTKASYRWILHQSTKRRDTRGVVDGVVAVRHVSDNDGEGREENGRAVGDEEVRGRR